MVFKFLTWLKNNFKNMYKMCKRSAKKWRCSMKNPKKLKRKHKIFLSKQGCNPDDFLIVTEDYDSYTFYNKVTKVVWNPIRR